MNHENREGTNRHACRVLFCFFHPFRVVVSECGLSLSLSDKVDMVAIRPCNLFRDIYSVHESRKIHPRSLLDPWTLDYLTGICSSYLGIRSTCCQGTPVFPLQRGSGWEANPLEMKKKLANLT